MKLLLDELTPVDDVGLVHTVLGINQRPYIRRRAYRSPQTAAKHYFNYCDMMSASGYTINNVVSRAWFYEVCWDGRVVETVEVQWPKRNWNDEMKLLEHKK